MKLPKVIPFFSEEDFGNSKDDDPEYLEIPLLPDSGGLPKTSLTIPAVPNEPPPPYPPNLEGEDFVCDKSSTFLKVEYSN